MKRALIMIVALLAATQSARAGGIVLESWVKQRAADADRLLSPVLDELAKRDFVAGPEAVGRSFETRVSRAPGSIVMPADFVEQVERGHSAWIAGNFDDAVRILTPLVEAAHANPRVLIQSQQHRDRLKRAMIAIALSEQRRGDPATMRMMFAEIVRSFPQAEIPRVMYGPEASQQFEAVRKEVTAKAKGQLTIEGDPAMAVFINERFERVGGGKGLELPPGEYRIFAQVGETTSRIYRVEVEAEREATVAIDFAFDGTLHTAPRWSGLAFDSIATRKQRESTYAVRFARQAGASAVAVLGVETVEGKRVLVGALLNMQSGRDIRRASISLDPDPPEHKLRQLGRFLAGDSDVKGLEGVIMDSRLVPSSPDASSDLDDDAATPRRRWGGWKVVAGTGAVAALATGGTLLFYDGKCTKPEMVGIPCQERYNFTAPGYATLGVGAALAAVTIYLVVRSPRTSSQVSVVPTRGGAFTMLTRRF